MFLKVGLTTGITGKDGSFLAELLLINGYEVLSPTKDLGNLNKLSN